jgi:hypothetical protein
MREKNKAIIEVILCLLKVYKMGMGLPESSGRESILKSLKYLIPQTIRQYDLPRTHYHLSVAAKRRWDKLSSEDIMQQHSQDHVDCDKLEGISITCLLFVGAKKEGTPAEITEDGFTFRQMFQQDHVVPVSMIFKQMLQMGNADAGTIRRLLNKMHICTILQEEDHMIGKTKGRCLDYRKTIDDVYTPAGIKLVF